VTYGEPESPANKQYIVWLQGGLFNPGESRCGTDRPYVPSEIRAPSPKDAARKYLLEGGRGLGGEMDRRDHQEKTWWVGVAPRDGGEVVSFKITMNFSVELNAEAEDAAAG
jgi:hypothetical protein